MTTMIMRMRRGMQTRKLVMMLLLLLPPPAGVGGGGGGGVQGLCLRMNHPDKSLFIRPFHFLQRSIRC